jgi:hypothetical protein
VKIAFPGIATLKSNSPAGKEMPGRVSARAGQGNNQVDIYNARTSSRNDVYRFPPRRSAAIRIVGDGAAWLVLAREHGWLHGSRAEAIADAQWLALNLGIPVRGSER